MKQVFNIGDIFRTSWSYTKSQLAILCGLLIGYVIIAFTLSIFSLPSQGSLSGQIVSNLVSCVVGIIFSLGYMKNLFQTIDGIEPQFSAYGQQFRKILVYFVANILCGLIISIGLILLLVPGIYLALRLQFFAAFIVEEDAGILDSMRRSWAITEDSAMKLFLLFLVQFLVILIGLLLLGIGIFIAIPLVYMMYCYAFRLLNSPLQLIEEA